MSYQVTRLTLYAILTSIEEDLRETVRFQIGGQGSTKEILGDEVWPRAMERLERDKSFIDRDPDLDDLLLYIDFGDAVKILNTRSSLLPPAIARCIKDLTPLLEKLLPIRHRVAHARPLQYDDLTVANESAHHFLRNSALPWMHLRETLSRLERDPSFVLGLQISTSEPETIRQAHNLPTPDFDETGFVGRREKVEQLIKLCLGTYPVVTIVGEGGIGKTALALKVAYDLLDLPDCPFDAIVWTSAKASVITPQEIVRIEVAIRDSLGMFEDVAVQLSGVKPDDTLSEILGYMNEFSVLLVLDNLETVLDDRIRSFLERLPKGSKVLITSRIGLGAFEIPVKLEAMREGDAIQLLRGLAASRGVEQLVKMPNSSLSKYCNRMKNNPGYVKWFVSAVQAGKRPEEVLANSELFLDYCMSNVYDHLSSDSRHILKVLLCLPGQRTQAELSYLGSLGVTELQRALQELLRTSMVVMHCVARGVSFESKYELSELAREYLAKHHRLMTDEVRSINKRKRQLVAVGEEVKAEMESDPYSFRNLSLRSKADLPVAKYLLDALKELRKRNFGKAIESIESARALAPDYFEVYRVEALARVRMGHIAEAHSAYEAAIELQPNSAPLRLWYGGFLMRYMDDIDASLVQFKEAAKLDPNASNVKAEMARAYLYMKRFAEAKDILDPLTSRTDLLLWDKRQAYDLLLQFHQRKAEFLLAKHDEFGALTCLLDLKAAYDSCPHELLDEKMREKLKKAIPTASNCTNFLNNPDTMKTSGELTSWLARESGLSFEEKARFNLIARRKGSIVRLRRDRGFGFLHSDDGVDYFFHFSEVRGRHAPTAIQIGQAVSFIIGENKHGHCALDVAIESTTVV